MGIKDSNQTNFKKNEIVDNDINKAVSNFLSQVSEENIKSPVEQFSTFIYAPSTA